MNIQHVDITIRKFTYRSIGGLVLLLLTHLSAYAQLSVTKTQDLTFGTFYPVGSGGSITVTSSGSRSATSNVVLLSTPAATPAVFELYAGNRKRTIWSVTNSSSVTLNRSGGGGSMTMFLGSPSSGTYFTISRYSYKIVQIGGTLYVGSITSNPPGDYSGSFYVTFNYY